ncbi:MAG: YraN family protein [Acidimicrobiia bacterium]|nr:YraN family protein [Acidimicrobiia bacterium]
MAGSRRSPDRRHALGAAGERLVADRYVARGFEIIDRNWRCRDGELDLVARNGRTIVFCEVKTRTSTAFGAPAEAVTREKQRRLRRLAGRWLEETGTHGADVRFDVASVLWPTGGEPTVTVIEAAF